MSTTRPSAPDEPRISVALADAHGSLVFARDAERAYYAASTMKLAVLLAASREVARGRLSLDDEVPVSRTFTAVDGSPFVLAGDHLDEQMPPPGTPLPLAQHLEAMISRSSNEATNSVMELVDLATVTRVAAEHGLRVERLIGDPVAVERGLTNEASAAALSRLMRVVVADNDLPQHLTDLHGEWLRRQTIAPVGAAVPTGVVWGSKSGEVDGYRHDVAFVGEPSSDEVHYLAVCTQGLGEAAADEAIAALTEALLPRMTG